MTTMPITAGADVRQIISDVTWSVWQTLTAHPPYASAPPELFSSLRQTVEDVLLAQWHRGGLSFVLATDRWSPDLVDRVAQTMERPAGGMARGPLGVLVADAVRRAVAPTARFVGRLPIWRVSAA